MPYVDGMKTKADVHITFICKVISLPVPISLSLSLSLHPYLPLFPPPLLPPSLSLLNKQIHHNLIHVVT